MNRRTVLGSVAGSLGVFAGCLDAVGNDSRERSDDDTNRSNDSENGRDDTDPSPADIGSCSDRIVPYMFLPDRVQSEVDAALEDGVYETEDELWYSHTVGSSSFLRKDSQYYESTVEVDSTAASLRLEETVPSLGWVELRFVNRTDSPLTLTVTVSEESGTTVATGEEIDVAPDDDLERGEHPTLDVPGVEYRTYEITTSVDGEQRGTETVSVSSGTTLDWDLRIESDEIDVRVPHIAMHWCEGAFDH